MAEYLDFKRQQLVQQLTEITGSDPNLAYELLDKKSWIVEEAIDLYYQCHEPPKESAGNSLDQQPSNVLPPACLPKAVRVIDMAPKKFRIITWNIDGLDEKNTLDRTLAVCRILQTNSPDVIFLQEVLPTTFAVIISKLSNEYHPIPSNTSQQYFTCVLLKSSTVTFLSSKLEVFPASKMMRALQIVNCKFAGNALQLMCSHLESTTNEAKERKAQFSRALALMVSASSDKTVIFGGDTNLRDREVARVGLPNVVQDLWKECGSPPEEEFTWDVGANDNLNWQFPNRPKLRFDRLFVRHAKPEQKMVPEKFELLGKERLKFGRFASDHWGIVCDFHINC